MPKNVMMPSATPAVISGSSMPKSEPKAIRMITAAAIRPMATLLESDAWFAVSMAWPPTSTCRPLRARRLDQVD